MSDLPVRTRLGFAAATVAVFLMAFLSYRSLEWRAEGARRVTQTLRDTQHLDALLSAYKDAETGQRGFLLTGEESYLQPYNAAPTVIGASLAQLRAAAEGDGQFRERFELLQRLGLEKMAELKQTVDLRRAGSADRALAIVRSDRGRELMDQIRTVITELKAVERTVLETRNREWESAAWVSTAVMWSGSGLLLFLIVAAALMSSRDFRIQQVEAWLRTGQSELAISVQGVDEIATLGETIAAFLARYLDARVGAVYFAAARARLLRVGAYGLPDAAPGSPQDQQSPAGLTRQAYTENTPIETPNVPDDFFVINSGLGKSKARHLIVAPVTADGVANGAVELGLFHAIAEHDRELLRRLGEPIGLALRAARDRSDLRAALEETQRQAEELQAQQEELRVQNEELEQQSTALRQSQTRLEDQQAELEQINAHLEEQTQAVERQRDSLLRAQRELQRASAYKSEFLANMSHELRTPLNSTLILAKLLSDNRDGNLNGEQIKFAETIYSAGNDLLVLINDILDLSKIEAGKMDVRPEEVPIARMRDELIDVFSPVARDKGIDLAFAIDPDVAPTIFTDPTRAQQVLKNLLSNALKFTERGGVALRARRAGADRIAFEVKDTGIGIPQEHHQSIFEVFRQADGTTSRKYGGTGLGLSISRDLARLLGGELLLDSTPGVGSTFTLVLPLRLATPASTPHEPPPVVARTVAQPPPPPVAAAEPDPEPPTPAGGRTILVVEDDVAFARVIERLAQELEFRVIVAATGEEGLTLAERHRPSAIILDIGLPDRSGLSVLDSLKHRATTRHIPVHVVSGSDYAQTALEMGAAGYAIKPVKRDDLIGALKRLETKFTQRLRRILVVEDDKVARESTCLLLAGRDIEVVAVGTAGEALQQLNVATFDCMVLDLTLPDRGGLDLLEEMSRSERYAFPPVIVYTGQSLSLAEEQKLRALSHSIIIKGVRSPERLLDEVTLFLHQIETDLPADRQRMLKDARHREAVFQGKRVLVVEDDVRNVFALSSVLEPKGAKVEIARNGREAVAHLHDKPGVDLVLMDIMMPEMNGLEAMREIRKVPANAKLPIIALTAKAMSDDREECLAAGANDYIAKPLDVDKLLSLARVWMRK